MKPGFKLIPLSGMLDGVSGVQLRRLVDQELKMGNQIILLDCSNVEFMDSSGLGSLVMVLKQVRTTGGRLSLCSLNDQLTLLLELTDMKDTFEVFPDRLAFEAAMVLW